MLKNLMMALVLALGFAASPLFAQCDGCKGCEGEKKAAEKVAGDKKDCKDCTDCKDCEGCDGCEKKEVVKTGETYEVVITELHCEKCSASVIKRLSKVENVASVKACHKSGKAWVTMKEGKTLSKEACETALKETDFKVTSCEVMKKCDKKEEKKDEKKAQG